MSIEVIRRIGDVIDLIREKRIERGLNQTQLAVFAGYKTPLTYKKKEEGESTFYYSDLEKLFPFLDITMIVSIEYDEQLKELKNPTHKMFSDFVRGVRNSKQITQKELAAKLGQTTANYLYKENCTNNRYFTLKEILHLAELLEFKIDIH
ncbi:MAG: hypothetical protein ACRCX2_03835 [Paraclostridium sp.]